MTDKKTGVFHFEIQAFLPHQIDYFWHSGLFHEPVTGDDLIESASKLCNRHLFQVGDPWNIFGGKVKKGNLCVENLVVEITMVDVTATP